MATYDSLCWFIDNWHSICLLYSLYAFLSARCLVQKWITVMVLWNFPRNLIHKRVPIAFVMVYRNYEFLCVVIFIVLHHFCLVRLKIPWNCHYSRIWDILKAKVFSIFTFTPCMLLHLFYVKPTHALFVKYTHIYI